MASDPGGGGDACPFCGGGNGNGNGGPMATTTGAARVAFGKRNVPAEAAARTGARDEAVALRRVVAQQQRGMAELEAELEAERGAAAGAASEAMSMILRLQREKSEAMMEARQFKRFAEERFAHDAAELSALQDGIAQRDASVRSLSAQLRACRARLLQLGLQAPSSLPSSPRGDGRCRNPFADDSRPAVHSVELPASADVGTPRTHHLLKTRSARARAASPRPSRHARTMSGDSLLAFDGGIALGIEIPPVMDRDAPDWDDMSDRVCTVDAVHGVPVAAPEDCSYISTPRGSEVGFVLGGVGAWAEEEQIQKLSARLQALEADRESMRQAIMSMGTQKAQAVLLKEIAHQLTKQAAPYPAVSMKRQSPLQPVVAVQRKVVKKQPSFAKIFILAVIKWIASVFSWRRKSDRIKYPLGLCGSNVGLMHLLDRLPKLRPRRFLKAS